MFADKRLFRDIDGIKGLAGGFYANPASDIFFAVIHQCQQQKNGFDHALHRKIFLVITYLIMAAVAVLNINTEVTGIPMRQFGNVSGNLAL